MSSVKLNRDLERLVVGIEELRQIRIAASIPYFKKSDSQSDISSRIQLISSERKRLYGSGWMKLRTSRRNKIEQLELEQENRRNNDDFYYQNNPKFILDSTDFNIECDEDKDGAELRYEDLNYSYNDSTSVTHSSLLLQSQDKEHHTKESNKLKATVKLLAESIEEIGNLRALLECSHNPAILQKLLNSKLFENTTTATTSTTDVSKYNTNIHNIHEKSDNNSLNKEFKYRALLLEQSKLIDQVSVPKLLDFIYTFAYNRMLMMNISVLYS